MKESNCSRTRVQYQSNHTHDNIAIFICLIYLLATVHMKNNVIMRSNHEYGYFGNVLEYEYD